MLVGLVEKLLVESTVKLLSITPKNYSNGMDACRKKIETVFVSLVSTLCGKTNLYDLSKRLLDMFD